ncbi:hypothetical protein ACQKRQ_34260 [Paraburkholderia sp. NPDC080076]|uniref:hypothetical protein n=1 Tax=Paraburkholderia sp. NPDC080076 TaxID=3390605 RepID=UPI003CFC11E7
MADFAAAYLRPAYEAHNNGQRLERSSDDAFESIFRGFTEISYTIDNLRLAGHLVSTSPPRSKNISKNQYINFVIGAYLQEMYILQQRLDAYGKKVSRLYGFRDLPKLVNDLVYKPLENIINIRGNHVHRERYSDAELRRISDLDLFLRVGHEAGEDFHFEYKLAQHSWKMRIRANNLAVSRIVDSYFDILQTLICEEGKVRFPVAAQTKASNSAGWLG